MAKSVNRVQLHGFNNLTKSLAFNIYDICYAKSEAQKRAYIEYIDEAYNAERLTGILNDVAGIIGADVLNVARQDYEPQGASVTMLVADEPVEHPRDSNSPEPGPLPEAVVGHLNKSHIAVHTYPESHPDNGISTFRVDIDVGTCGLISPLKALNYLIHSFESDILRIDYRVRGFTRDVTGKKLFIDHEMESIQSYLAEDTKDRYEMIDVNLGQENIFHTKMMLKDFDLDDYLFGCTAGDLPEEERRRIAKALKKEMEEMFHGHNLS